MEKEPSVTAPPAELEDLRARLEEAEEILNAIRNGEVDALMLGGEKDPQVHTLSGVYRQLIETMSEGAVTLSADGIILYCNVRITELLGWPLEKLLGTPLRDYMQPEDRDMLAALLVKAHTTPSRQELNLKTGEGRLIPVYLSVSRLLNRHDETAFSLVITDLTEQKQHDKIVEAERLARLILEQAVEAIIVCDQQGAIIRSSQAARQLCSDNPLLKPFDAMLPLQTDDSVPFRIDSILAGETLHNADVTLERNGQILHLLLNAGPLLSGKEILGCVIMLTDITERKRDESYRELNREILQILNEPSDLQDAFLRVVSALKTQTGFDAVGLRFQDGDDFPFYHQEGFPEDFLLTENSLIGRDRDEGVCRNKDGSICLECTCGLVLSGQTDPTSPFFTPGGSFWTNDSFPMLDLPFDQDPRLHPRNECIHQGYASVALIPIKTKEGITGLIQLNDRRKGCFTLETVQLLEGIAAHIGEAILHKQTDDQVKKLARFPAENPNPVLRISTQGILEYANAAAERILPVLDAATIGEPVNAEWRVHIDEAMANARPIDIEFQAAGRTFDATLTAVTNHGYVNLYARDISEQRQVESQLRQSQKMESVGRLAGGVAHDFNNILQAILGYTEMAMGETDPSDPLFSDLQEIKKAGLRSGDLTRQLLAFAREQPVSPVILNLNDEISKILNMLRRLLREEVNLVWSPGTNLHSVKLDPSQIDQILVNLCVNAQDAICGTGEIILETANAKLDETYCATHAEAVPGDYIILTVSDTGCGMNRPTLEKLFEPFFTTKEVGKGTGLGLATVYGIVKQNGGFITVYSEPEQGTTFKIHLPQTLDLFQETDKADATRLPEVHGETVLLVEDELSLRTLYSQFLEALGYTAMTAESPQEALELSSQHPDDIQLLLTDIVMPGMNGKELADAICAVNPEIHVLFMSGYSADVIAARGVLEQDVDFIAKPFSCSDLARKLHETLRCHGQPPGRV